MQTIEILNVELILFVSSDSDGWRSVVGIEYHKNRQLRSQLPFWKVSIDITKKLPKWAAFQANSTPRKLEQVKHIPAQQQVPQTLIKEFYSILSDQI